MSKLTHVPSRQKKVKPETRFLPVSFMAQAVGGPCFHGAVERLTVEVWADFLKEEDDVNQHIDRTNDGNTHLGLGRTGKITLFKCHDFCNLSAERDSSKRF